MRFSGSVIFVLCLVGTVFGQGYVPYTPGSTTVLNNVVPPPMSPPMIPIPPNPASVLPMHEWHDGMRESFTHTDVHEIRPIKEWESYPGYQQPAGYQQPVIGYQQPVAGYQQPVVGYQQPVVGYQQPQYQYPASEGWYWNPSTSNYQRNCQPQYQQQYCQPQCQQQQYRCYPVYQCYPQYRAQSSWFPW